MCIFLNEETFEFKEERSDKSKVTHGSNKDKTNKSDNCKIAKLSKSNIIMCLLKSFWRHIID